MTTHFDEALHPRGTEGKFTTAQHTADGSVVLAPPVPDPLVDRTSEALLEFFSADGSITVCSGDLGGEVEEGDFNPLWDEPGVVADMAAAACLAYRESAGAAEGDLRSAVMNAVAGSVDDDVTICTRVWEAWSYGTMTAADFAPISSDDDVLADLADVVLAAAAAAAAGETDAVSAHMQA